MDIERAVNHIAREIPGQLPALPQPAPRYIPIPTPAFAQTVLCPICGQRPAVAEYGIAFGGPGIGFRPCDDCLRDIENGMTL